MKRLLFILLVCVNVVLHAQNERKLVADETWYVKSGQTGFRIISSNDTISIKIIKKFGDIMTRMTHVKKRDRLGIYWERSFYFKNEDHNIVVLFINNGFK